MKSDFCYNVVPGGAFVAPFVERAVDRGSRHVDIDRADTVFVFATASVSASDVSSLLAGRPQAVVLVTTDDCDDAASVRRIVGDWAEALNARFSHISTGWIIGTGMDGAPRRIVSQIGRGMFWAVDGADAPRAVVHALDVGRVAVSVAGQAGDFELHDGTSTTMSTLAAALASRIDRRGISHISRRRARRLVPFAGLLGDYTSLNRRDFNLAFTPLTLDNSALEAAIGPLVPVNVVDYLTNHNYTDEDV